MSGFGSLVSFLFDPIALTWWFLLALTIVAWRRPWGRSIRFATTAWMLLLCLLGSPVVANAMLGWVEDQATALATCPAPPDDAILIVLAGGIQSVADTPEQYEKLKEATIFRVLPATRIARRLGQSTLLMTGGLGDSVREADLMAALARDLGMPPERIWTEYESSSTASSAKATRALIDAKDTKTRPLYLVTSASHMPRAAAAFHSAGVQVCPLPVDYRRLHPPLADALVPRITALWKSITAVREIASYAAYRLLGQIRS